MANATRSNPGKIRQLECPSQISTAQHVFLRALLSDDRIALALHREGDLRSFLNHGGLTADLNVQDAAKKAIAKAGQYMPSTRTSGITICGGICGLVENSGCTSAKPGEGIIVTSSFNGEQITSVYTMQDIRPNNAKRAQVIDPNSGISKEWPIFVQVSPIICIAAISSNSAGSEPIVYSFNGEVSLAESIANMKSERRDDQVWFYAAFGYFELTVRAWTRLFNGAFIPGEHTQSINVNGPSVLIGVVDPSNVYEKESHTHGLTLSTDLKLGLMGGHTVTANSTGHGYLFGFPATC